MLLRSDGRREKLNKYVHFYFLAPYLLTWSCSFCFDNFYSIFQTSCLMCEWGDWYVPIFYVADRKLSVIFWWTTWVFFTLWNGAKVLVRLRMQSRDCSAILMYFSVQAEWRFYSVLITALKLPLPNSLAQYCLWFSVWSLHKLVINIYVIRGYVKVRLLRKSLHYWSFQMFTKLTFKTASCISGNSLNQGGHINCISSKHHGDVSTLLSKTRERAGF